MSAWTSWRSHTAEPARQRDARAAISLFFCAAFVAALVATLRSFRVDPSTAQRHE